MQSKEYITKKYIMKLPMILIALVIGFFDVGAFGIKELSPLFYICYIYFFIGVVTGILLLGKRELVIPGLIIMSVVQLLISRDRVLAVNILIALGALIFTMVLISDRIEKWAFPVFVLANIIYFLITKTENRLVIICLVVGALYSLGSVLKKDVRYRYAVPLLLLLVCLIPVKDEPVRWTFFRNAINRVIEFGDDVLEKLGLDFGGSGLGTSYSGYSGVGTLHGSVEGDAEKDIRFKKNGDSKTLYLTGSRFSTLTKEGFVDKTNISPDYNAWFVSFMNSLMDSDISRKEAVCFIKVESAEVTYEHLKTKDIIYPGNLLDINKSLEKGSKKKHKKGFNYKIQYMVVDFASPYYQKVAECMAPDYSAEGKTAKKFHSYAEIEKYTYDTLKIKVSGFMSEERYNEIVKGLEDGSYREDLAPYLDTSMSNERIQALSDELTENCKNDFEKAKVIENYLRKYTYNTDTDLRDSENYVDAFLFETKGGYCVHFASSMVLLLRDAGIPARYVSGYLYEVNDEHVMSTDAHAWVEAYIDGIGWTRFEPTASIVASETWGLVAAEDTEETASTDWDDYYEGEVQEPDIEKGKEYYDHYGESQTSEDESEKQVKSEIVKRILIYVLYIVGAGILLLLLTVLSRRIWFRLLPPEKKLKEMVKKTCRGIEKQIESEEEKAELQKNTSSLYDYMKYVSDENRAKTRALFDTYYKVRFRGDSVNNEDVKKLIKKAS